MNQRNSWIPPVTLFPIIYLVGWLFVRPLLLVRSKYIQENIDLIGTILTFLLLLYILPGWGKLRWSNKDVWKEIGIIGISRGLSLIYFIRGIFLAVLFLSILVISLYLTSSASFQVGLTIEILLNSIFLGLGVGLAEEIIFRSWLTRELQEILGFNASILTQALIFSIAHLTSGLSLTSSLLLLIGLFLLAIVLSLMRILSFGSLWVGIGFHGGLVGGWFLISSSFIELNPSASSWIVGPGKLSPNPIGSLVSIISLSLFLYFYRTAFARAGKPESGARNASSRGTFP